MKHKRFSDEQIIGVLKEHEAGIVYEELQARLERLSAHERASGWGW